MKTQLESIKSSYSLLENTNVKEIVCYDWHTKIKIKNCEGYNN